MKRVILDIYALNIYLSIMDTQLGLKITFKINANDSQFRVSAKKIDFT